MLGKYIRIKKLLQGTFEAQRRFALVKTMSILYDTRKQGALAAMNEMVPGIQVQVKKGEAYYTVTWSPLKKADKYEITLKVPAVSGLYEIYRMDKDKKLNLLAVTHAWYGGLRSQIRIAIDPELTEDAVRKAALESGDIYYRYTVSNSLSDLLDVVWFLHMTYFPDDVRVESSGRYPKIYLGEKSPDKLFWLD